MAEETQGEAATLEIRLFGRTDVGLVREHNEDSFLVMRLDDGSVELDALRQHALQGKGTLLVVCDGMGGAAAGEVASQMAVASMGETMRDGDGERAPAGVTDDVKTSVARKLRHAARTANERIFKEARHNLARSGMGTTMTAAILHERHAIIAQVGDSRAYLWRKGAFTQVTRDQSLVNQLIETGQITVEQAKFFEHSNVILQALGVQEDVEVQLSQVELRRGDRLMLCSDGLVGVVPDEEIGAILGAGDSPEETTQALIDVANAAGGPDNISVIVAHLGGAALEEAADDDLISYKLWQIDPETEEEVPSFADTPTAVESSARRTVKSVRVASPRSRLAALASMGVVGGLILGAISAGAAIYRRGVRCEVDARMAGLVVFTDGRDSGARTTGAPVKLRLSAGHHTVALRGYGAPTEVEEVDVRPEEACAIRFGIGEATR